jgi:hypothetical protein
VTASAAEEKRPLPRPPRLLGALRAAASDFLAHSWRLVVANLAWGTGLVMLVGATAVTPLAWFLTPLLALPTVGIYRIAALIVRDEPVSIRDGFAAWFRFGARALVVGGLLSGSAAVLATNLVSGLEARGVLGWSLATFAGWGLVTVGVLAAVVWPLLVDPWRADLGLRAVLRLAALLALAYPLRFGALAVLLLGVLALSTLAVVAVFSVAIGFAALLASRYVLPASDRFAARFDEATPDVAREREA